MNKKIAIIAIAGTILLAVVLLGVKLNIGGESNEVESILSQGPVEILISDTDVTPSEVAVQVGATITFKNVGTRGHWPASDPHPTHSIYPEFDPKKSIEPGESWSFTFDKVGLWNFHDHMSPSLRGVVRVVLANTTAMHPVKTAFDPKCVELSTDFSCFEQYYHSLVEKEGVAAGFVDLKKRYADDSYVRSQCHPLTHVLGHAAVKRYPNVTDAYAHGDAFCWSGYYHGVMEGVVENIGEEQVLAKLNTICANIPGKSSYSFDYYNCVHGLGHGLMAMSANELMGTLDICATLVGGWEQSACYGGAFMENVIVDNKGHTTKYLRPSDPLYPCNAVARQYKASCYLMQTSYMLKLVSDDFNQVFGLCRTADIGYENICFQSLGRDVSGQSLSNAERTKVTCMLGLDYNEQSNCIIGAVKDFISYYHSDVEAKNLCNSLTTDLKNICLSTAQSYYASF